MQLDDVRGRLKLINAAIGTACFMQPCIRVRKRRRARIRTQKVAFRARLLTRLAPFFGAVFFVLDALGPLLASVQHGSADNLNARRRLIETRRPLVRAE